MQSHVHLGVFFSKNPQNHADARVKLLLAAVHEETKHKILYLKNSFKVRVLCGHIYKLN